MSLAEFVESLIIGKFGNIPSGHVRLNPLIHPEIPKNVGETRQLGIVQGVRFYADPGIPGGQARFIDAEGKVTILSAFEEKEVEQETPAEKPRKKKPGRKRKTRSV